MCQRTYFYQCLCNRNKFLFWYVDWNTIRGLLQWEYKCSNCFDVLGKLILTSSQSNFYISNNIYNLNIYTEYGGCIIAPPIGFNSPNHSGRSILAQVVILLFSYCILCAIYPIDISKQIDFSCLPLVFVNRSNVSTVPMTQKKWRWKFSLTCIHSEHIYMYINII